MSSSQVLSIDRSAGEDQVWIRETLSGKTGAFAQIMQKYQGPLYAMARRVLRNATEAEDILQDAFVQAYRHLGDFRNDAQLSTWLYSIVLNRVRNRLRQNKIVQWSSLDGPRTGDDETFVQERPSPDPLPDQLVERKLELEKIAQLVDHFPRHYRAVFVLYYFHHLSVEQVSGRLKRPIGTVKVYLHRARQLLFKRLRSERSSKSNWRLTGLAAAS